ncbi:MAG: hypothetical protein ACR2PZ_19735 [Pseudomonadales bacterium]
MFAFCSSYTEVAAAEPALAEAIAPESVELAFAQSALTLDPQHPPRFLLHYSGPVAAFRGILCYRFAGYSETCFKPKLQWLTPSTTLTFYAPGGVPVELLRAYRLEVTAPGMFHGQFSYDVDPN